MAYTPKRGDLVWTDFDPSAGYEQAHKRPAIVLSPEAFNGKLKLALVAPITSRVKGHGFEVALRDRFADVAFTVWASGIIEAEDRPMPQLFNMDNEPIERTVRQTRRPVIRRSSGSSI
jgi:hypothetical protein